MDCTIEDKCIEQKQLHDVTTLAAELKQLLVRYGSALNEAGIRSDMDKLENWLEEERKGPAPANVISEGGITWLTALRDKLKLSAEEAQRLEGEGGNPGTREQSEKNEELLKTVRKIDHIIDESAVTQPH